MIRTILIPQSQTVLFQVPIDYVGKELEVIAFTTKEAWGENNNSQKNVSFSAISLDTKGVNFNRDEANQR
ncbi:MAG: hypothetical protein RL065_782 [Bacteroidota bacterium]